MGNQSDPFDMYNHDVKLKWTASTTDTKDEIDQLKAENAELREELADARQIMADELERQISDYRARHIEQAGTITELESENSELRELVRDMYKAFFSLDIDQCQACPREDDCVYMYRVSDCMQCAFERDMRWLGIEAGA